MKGSRKHVLWIAVLCTLLVATYEYGPTGWEAWQFKRAMDLQARIATNKNPRAADLAQTCGLCHGAAGNSLSAEYPKLAGQPTAYLLKQLNSFADGDRLAAQMQPLAAQLTTEERQLISAYYAELPAVRHSGSSSVAASLSQCTACHGTALEGRTSPLIAPRLAGQGSQYLLKQLQAFKTGQRKDPSGAMTGITRDMSQSQLEALTDAIAAY